MNTGDLLGSLKRKASPEELAVLKRALNRMPAGDADATVSEEYAHVLNNAVTRLAENIERRLAKQQEINQAQAEERAQKIVEKQQIQKELRNQDATVYLAATLLGRSGDPKAAQAINTSYQAYKQLSFLSNQNIQEYGAAAMTAGYVGVALLVVDYFATSSQPSAEQQMMQQMQLMFQALQKSIQDFREEVSDKLEGLSNGQLQILSAIEQAADKINSNVILNSFRLRTELRNIQDLIEAEYKRDHDKITRTLTSKIIDHISVFNEATGSGLTDQRENDLRKAFQSLNNIVVNTEYTGPHSMSYTGDKLDVWNAEKIIKALKPEVIISPDFNVGVIPAIAEGLGVENDKYISHIPNPIEWGRAAKTLLAGYYKFPEIARSVESNQGKFLSAVEEIDSNIEHAMGALLSESTFQSALERYQTLADQLSQLSNHVHDEIVMNLLRQNQGKSYITSQSEYEQVLESIGQDNLPDFYLTGFTSKQIDEFGKKDKKWLDGRLDITSPNIRPFKVSGTIKGDLKRRNDKEYITSNTIQQARSYLYKEPTVENTMFVNGDYDRYRIKGSHHKGAHQFTAPDGRVLTASYRDRNIQIKNRFQTNYDILGTAGTYGMVSMQTGKWTPRELYSVGITGGKALVYGEIYRTNTYKFTSGPRISFRLRETYLAAPTNPRSPITSNRQSKRLSALTDKKNVTQLSAPSHRLPSDVRNFGTEKRHVRNSEQLVKALHRELYHYQKRVRKAIVENIQHMVEDVPHMPGIGLSASRYDDRRQEVQVIVTEMQAVSSVLRYMSAMGLMVKGVDMRIVTQVAKGQYTSPNVESGEDVNITEASLPETPQDFVRLIEGIQNVKQAPLDENGNPLNIRDYINTQFKDEVSQRLEIYHQRHLQGLEDSKKIPLNKNIRKAVASLKYVK